MAVRDTQELGALIRQRRSELGLSQEDLAERAGVSVRSISDLERGLQRVPRPTTLRSLADALMLSPGQRALFMGAASRVRGEDQLVAPAEVQESRPAVPGRGPWRLAALVLLGIVAVVIASVGILMHRGSSRGVAVTMHSTVQAPVVLDAWGGSSSRLLALSPNLDEFVLGPSGRMYLTRFGSMNAALRFSAEGRNLGVLQVDTGPKGIGPVAVDAHGNLWATTRIGVRELSPDGRVLRTWSTGLNPGQVSGGLGIAVDHNGDVIVGEIYGHRVQVLTPTGRRLYVWGGPGNNVQRFEPNILTVDAYDNVYVLDTGNRQVERYTLQGKLLGAWRPAGFSLAGHPGIDLSLDRDGNLYVLESASGSVHVQKLSPSGQELARWDSTGSHPRIPRGIFTLQFTSAGYGFMTGPSGPIMKVDGDLHVLASWPLHRFERPLLHAPAALATDTAGNVYITDPHSHQVIRLSTNSGSARAWHASIWNTPGRYPSGIAIDGHGDVLVAGTGTSRVDVYSLSGRLVRHEDVVRPPAGDHLSYQALGADAGGNVTTLGYPDARIRVFSPSGTLSRSWCATCGIPSVSTPAAMTVDRAGNVYVALSSEIVKFSPRGIPLRSWRPGGSSGGQYDFAGLAVDSRGNVYVTNRTQHALQIFSPSGRMVTSWTHLGPKGPQLTNPGAVALDSRNDIVLIDGTRVLELAPLRLRRSA